MSMIQSEPDKNRDPLEAIPEVQVSIKIYYPDGATSIMNDPEDYSVSEGHLWVKMVDRELRFNNLPYFISDKREKKKKTGFV